MYLRGILYERKRKKYFLCIWKIVVIRIQEHLWELLFKGAMIPSFLSTVKASSIYRLLWSAWEVVFLYGFLGRVLLLFGFSEQFLFGLIRHFLFSFSLGSTKRFCNIFF